MPFSYESEAFLWGDDVRRRVTRVRASGLSLSHPTERLIGGAAPSPLSQYPSSGDTPGFRIAHTERGHLVGLQFGGPESAGNLVPMYAGFNGGSGAWGRFEAAMSNYLSQTGDTLGLDVIVQYPDGEAAVPSLMTAVVASGRGGTLPDTVAGFRVFMHTGPTLYFRDLLPGEESLYDSLIRWTRRMAHERWLVEEDPRVTVPGSGRVSRSAPLGRTLTLSIGDLDTGPLKAKGDRGWAVIYASRPYAVLDYLKVTQPAEYRNLGFPSFSYDNTTGFKDAQREAIQKVNVIFNIGYMRSDLAFSPHEPWQDLMPGSADAAPQVDHAAGRAGSGSNAYSNARLVSKAMNLKLRTAETSRAVIDYYNDEANWATIITRLRNVYG